LSAEFYYVLIFLLCGGVVGFLAGLLGIGGGSVMVPVLSMIFAARGYAPDHVVHLALATSMATIIPGGFMSALTHHQHGAVDWQILKRMLPGILAGTFSGAVIAHFASTAFLKGFFVAFICFLVVQMLFDFSKRIPQRVTAVLPSAIGLVFFGFVMGVISSFAGIGGAVLSIAYLLWCGFAMHRAIGTAAALGVPLAIAGTFGFIVTGINDKSLPAWSLGYVYLPAVLCIAITSILAAPVGARLAHRLPVAALKKIFVVLLLALAIKMFVSV
jgi:uncharacterized protein